MLSVCVDRWDMFSNRDDSLAIIFLLPTTSTESRGQPKAETGSPHQSVHIPAVPVSDATGPADYSIEDG